MSTLKQQLYNLCMAHVTATIRNAEAIIADAREAAQNETKSSAGDKYETAREMMQQDIDMNTARLNTARAQQQVLDHIHADQPCTLAIPGALVKTSNGNFYIAISAGQLMVEGIKYYAISLESPAGARLRGMKEGDSFSLNGRIFNIVSIS